MNVFFSPGINYEYASAHRIRNVNVAIAVNCDPLRVLECILREGQQRRPLPVELVNELASGVGDVYVAKRIGRDAYRFRELSGASASHTELSNEFQNRRRGCWRFCFRGRLRASCKSCDGDDCEKTSGSTTPRAKGHTLINLSHLHASVALNHVRWNALINASAFATFEVSLLRLASRGEQLSGASHSRAELPRHC